MKIGIFGGTFDPIHTGHAILLNHISQYCGFDEVWVMVARKNPLKHNRISASDSDRLKMAQVVANKFQNVKVSDFELGLPIPSYTIDTLTALRESFPKHDFSIIIGGDSWNDFILWKDYRRIIEEFGVSVYRRGGIESKQIDEGDLKVRELTDTPIVEISSSLIRKMVKEGKNISFLVPSEVESYIKQNNLYLSSSFI